MRKQSLCRIVFSFPRLGELGTEICCCKYLEVRSILALTRWIVDNLVESMAALFFCEFGIIHAKK